MEKEGKNDRRQLHEGHRQRIKARYLENGIGALDDKDILELLLTYAIPRRDVYDISRRLVNEFGSVGNVLAADPKLLTEKGRISEHTAILLKLVNDLMADSLSFIEYRREQLSSVRSACEYCHRVLSRFDEEIVIVLYLDSESNVTELTKVSCGTSDSAVLPIETIVGAAVRNGAKRILAAHNHPSFSSAPSSSDVFATDLLKCALAGRGIELAEHIIVAKNSCTALIHHQTIELEQQDPVVPWK